MKRASGDMSVGVGGSMIRVEEEGEDLDDDNALDEEEEEDESDIDDAGSVNQEELAPEDQDADGQSSPHRHRHQQQPQQQEPSLPAALLAPSSSGSSGRRLGRRASSAVLPYGSTPATSTPATKALPAAGDKELRPHFLKERSATIMHMADGNGSHVGKGGRGSSDPPVESPQVPQSKASTFLMSVLAKSRALSGGPYGHSIGPVDMLAGGTMLNSGSSTRPATTNAIHYTQVGKDQGQRLRSHPSRRSGRTLLTLGHDWRQLVEGSAREEGGCIDGNGDEERSANQRPQTATPAEMVAELRRHRQQLPEQLALLTRIHHYLDEFGMMDEEEHLPLCAAFVDAGLLVEVAAVMREFRFHAYFHICAAKVLTVLSSASSLYAFMMAELGVESILQKSVTVHATHDRLVMMASALLHVMEESKTPANVQAARNLKAVTEKQRATYFTDLVHTQLGLSSKDTSPKKRSAARASPMVNSQPAVSPRHSSGKGEDYPTSRPIVPPLFGKRAVSSSHSASRLRQLLTERLAPPPKLSAHYNLVSAKSPSSMLLPPSSTPLTDRDDEARPRPATSPAKRSLPIDLKLLSSSQSAASAYGDSVVFVEPSPLHKRLPLRGVSHSASGVRRRLSARRDSSKRLESLTPRMFSSGPVSASDPLEDSRMEHGSTVSKDAGGAGPTLLSLPSAIVRSERSTDGEPGAGRPFEGHQDADADTSQAKRKTEGPKGDDDEDVYDDESYEDDFSPADDVAEDQQGQEDKKTSSDDSKTLTGREDLTRIDSDNELMDMLADLAHHKSDTSTRRSDGGCTPDASVKATNAGANTPNLATEVAAATCIQRHVRGVSTRRLLTLERRVEMIARSKTAYAPRSTLATGKLWQATPCPKARTRSLGTRSVSGKRATRRSRSQSRSPSPSPSPSCAAASPSLPSNPPTRTARSVSALVHRPLPQPSTPAKRSASLAGGTKRAASLAPRARSSVPARSTSSDADAARDGDDQASSSTVVVVDASPSIELAADALFGGPDPLRRLQDLYAEGLRLHRAGQVAEAAARYEAALALAPASGRAFASVHLNLGSARMALGDAAAALAAFREARRVQPASAKAAFNEALALLRLGRTREGSRVLREVVRLEPTHERAREALAHVEGAG